jgi:hypothetical protein
LHKSNRRQTASRRKRNPLDRFRLAKQHTYFEAAHRNGRYIGENKILRREIFPDFDGQKLQSNTVQ